MTKKIYLKLKIYHIQVKERQQVLKTKVLYMLVNDGFISICETEDCASRLHRWIGEQIRSSHNTQERVDMNH